MVNRYLLILLLLCFPSTLIAAPVNSDTIVSDKLMDALENTQIGYLNSHGRYQQVKEKMHQRIVYYMHEYHGECGKGYVVFTDRVIDGKLWRRQRHTGCEDRIIHTDWTQIN